MTILIGSENNLRDTLQNLASLEYDTAAAYGSAARRVTKPASNERFIELKRRHESRAQRLAPIIRGFGERPPRAGGWRQVVTQGRVLANGLMGKRALIEAIVRNERDVHDAYDRASRRDDVMGPLEDVLVHYRDDARRYHAELVQQLVQVD